MKKWVYLSTTARQELKTILGREPDRREMQMFLGNQGTTLAETAGVGLPVPSCFTIITDACIEYVETGGFPEGMWDQVVGALHTIGGQTGKIFGDASNLSWPKSPSVPKPAPTD